MEKEHFERQIHQWLSDNMVNHKIKDQGNIVNVAFHHLIRWYPQISTCGRDTYALDLIGKLRNWRITSRAINSFRQAYDNLDANSNISLLNKTFNESTHPEHNISVNLMKIKLLNLQQLNIENIRNCLQNNYEVVLISKEEKNVLNGSPNKQYILDGNLINGAGLAIKGEANERLNIIESSINEEETLSLINELFNRFNCLTRK